VACRFSIEAKGRGLLQLLLGPASTPAPLSRRTTQPAPQWRRRRTRTRSIAGLAFASLAASAWARTVARLLFGRQRFGGALLFPRGHEHSAWRWCSSSSRRRGILFTRGDEKLAGVFEAWRRSASAHAGFGASRSSHCRA